MIDTILSVLILLGVIVACLAARRRNSQRMAAAVSAAHASGYAEGGSAAAASMGNVTSVTVGGRASDTLDDLRSISDSELAIIKAQLAAEMVRRDFGDRMLPAGRSLGGLGGGAVLEHDDDHDDLDGFRSGSDDYDDVGAYDNHGATALGVVPSGIGAGVAGRRVTFARPIRRSGSVGDRLADSVGVDSGSA